VASMLLRLLISVLGACSSLLRGCVGASRHSRFLMKLSSLGSIGLSLWLGWMSTRREMMDLFCCRAIWDREQPLSLVATEELCSMVGSDRLRAGNVEVTFWKQEQ